MLDEYFDNTDEVFVSDSRRDRLDAKMADTLGWGLCRMYEGLPKKTGSKKVEVNLPRRLACREEMNYGGILEFSPVTYPLAVIFEYTGSGSLLLCDEDLVPVFTLELDGSEGRLETKRFFTDNVSSAICYAYVTQSVCARKFTIYDKGNMTNIFEIPRKGMCSFAVGDDCGRIKAMEMLSGKQINLGSLELSNDFGYLDADNRYDGEIVALTYEKKAPEISENVPDDFEIPLCGTEFDALVSLCAAELCRSEDSNLYERLLQKYKDLYEGLWSFANKTIQRNGFYTAVNRRRW